MRRSAGLLLVLFVGHLSMVAGGAVCVVPAMAPMSGPVTAAAAPAVLPMAGMAMGAAAATEGGSAVMAATEGATSEQSPCSGPASGTCATTMPCITALGADAAVVLASSTSITVQVQSQSVRVPASTASAPDLPPPRA